MKFSAHGNIDYYIQNKCVVNQPSSGFNKEGVDILFTSIVNSLREKQIMEWVLIEILGENALPTPEAQQALVNNYRIVKEMGCVKISAVCFNALQKQFLVEVSKLTNIEIYFYSSEQDAFRENEDYL